MLQDVPPLPAGKTYRQILEETILKPGRDVESWAWGAHPEMPKGLSRQAIVFLHLPKCANSCLIVPLTPINPKRKIVNPKICQRTTSQYCTCQSALPLSLCSPSKKSLTVLHRQKNGLLSSLFVPFPDKRFTVLHLPKCATPVS